MTPLRSLLFLLAVCAILAPGLAQAQGPAGSRPTGSPVQPTIAMGHNGMDTSFARIRTDPRPGYDGPGSPVEARILIKNSSGVEGAHILMFGFNGLSDSIEIKMGDVTDAKGMLLQIAQDNRSDSLRQPKVWIAPENAPTDVEIVLRGTVTAKANGQIHVGAIVIAFDKDYNKFVTPQNEYAEVYAFGLLRAADAVDVEGRPPFQGQGNVPSVGILPILAALGLVALLRRRI